MAKKRAKKPAKKTAKKATAKKAKRGKKAEPTAVATPEGWAAVECCLQAASDQAVAIGNAEGASKYARQYVNVICALNAKTGKVVREAIANAKNEAEAAKESEALLARRKKLQEA